MSKNVYDNMPNYIESAFNVFQLVNNRATKQQDKRLKIISLVIFNYVNKLAHDYNIDLIDNKNTRLNQKEFRKELIKKYNGKCIISNSDCLTELDACHIIAHSEENNYSVSNGLLLKKNLHASFDDNLWCINPNTMCIEIKQNYNVGEIKFYENIKLNIDVDNDLYLSLLNKYKLFIR